MLVMRELKKIDKVAYIPGLPAFTGALRILMSFGLWWMRLGGNSAVTGGETAD